MGAEHAQKQEVGGGEGGEAKTASRVYYKGENINSPLAVGRDVSIGSHCRATPERLAAKRGEADVEESAPCISLYTPQLLTQSSISKQRGAPGRSALQLLFLLL